MGRSQGFYFRYVAGSMFFAVAPDRAALSDLNGELIIAWEQVMLAPAELMRVIRPYQEFCVRGHSEARFGLGETHDHTERID